MTHQQKLSDKPPLIKLELTQDEAVELCQLLYNNKYQTPRAEYILEKLEKEVSNATDDGRLIHRCEKNDRICITGEVNGWWTFTIKKESVYVDYCPFCGKDLYED